MLTGAGYGLYPLRGKPEGMVGAIIYTRLATDTFFSGVHLLLSAGYAFGVMAPYARQRASFHKKGDPDAGAIIDGVAFNIEKKTHYYLGERGKVI